jgi:hypothetical protein
MTLTPLIYLKSPFFTASSMRLMLKIVTQFLFARGHFGERHALIEQQQSRDHPAIIARVLLAAC